MQTKKSTPQQVAHHIKGIRLVLDAMEQRGFSTVECLRNTGIQLRHFDEPDSGIELQQEFDFYRNILNLCKEPMLGIELGAIYRLETYGLFGYALLSAQTMGESLALAVDLGALSYTHFRFSQFADADAAGIAFSDAQDLPDDLLPFYSDRDVQASLTAFASQDLLSAGPQEIRLMHDGNGVSDAYESHFGCPVIFGYPRNEVLFDSALLKQPLPQRDMETSAYCRSQCQRLLEKLSARGSFVESVRTIMVAQPGEFPSVEVVAERMDMSVRTLRRRLVNEGSSYQQLLAEIRQQLAQDYLLTDMPIEQIAELLAYTEPGNFSHAFKRWLGMSPKQYRALHR